MDENFSPNLPLVPVCDDHSSGSLSSVHDCHPCDPPSLDLPIEVIEVLSSIHKPKNALRVIARNLINVGSVLPFRRQPSRTRAALIQRRASDTCPKSHVRHRHLAVAKLPRTVRSWRQRRVHLRLIQSLQQPRRVKQPKTSIKRRRQTQSPGLVAVAPKRMRAYRLKRQDTIPEASTWKLSRNCRRRMARFDSQIAVPPAPPPSPALTPRQETPVCPTPPSEQSAAPSAATPAVSHEDKERAASRRPKRARSEDSSLPTNHLRAFRRFRESAKCEPVSPSSRAFTSKQRRPVNRARNDALPQSRKDVRRNRKDAPQESSLKQPEQQRNPSRDESPEEPPAQPVRTDDLMQPVDPAQLSVNTPVPDAATDAASSTSSVTAGCHLVHDVAPEPAIIAIPIAADSVSEPCATLVQNDAPATPTAPLPAIIANERHPMHATVFEPAIAAAPVQTPDPTGEACATRLYLKRSHPTICRTAINFCAPPTKPRSSAPTQHPRHRRNLSPQTRRIANNAVRPSARVMRNLRTAECARSGDVAKKQSRALGSPKRPNVRPCKTCRAARSGSLYRVKCVPLILLLLSCAPHRRVMLSPLPWLLL